MGEVPLTAEEVLALITPDGNLAMYLAQNRKANELAQAIDTYRLRLDGEDKGFERWLSASLKLKEISENLDFLKQLVSKEYGIENLNEETLASTNMLEQFLHSKKKAV